jgi:hypothetical protein
VIVANARQVKWIRASDRKSDRMDTKKLAWLARADVRLLTPVEHRTAEQQAELSVIRARDAVVRARTLLVNTARGIAKNFGQRLPATVTATFGKRALVMLPPMLQTALTGLLEQIDALGKQIQDYEERIPAWSINTSKVPSSSETPSFCVLCSTITNTERSGIQRTHPVYTPVLRMLPGMKQTTHVLLVLIAVGSAVRGRADTFVGGATSTPEPYWPTPGMPKPLRRLPIASKPT